MQCYVQAYIQAIVNRLKRWLPHLIFPSQSAFVPGRLITENVLMAFEILHYLKQHQKCKKSYIALKFNMSKAYNGIELGFLEEVMTTMGFEPK